MYSSASIYWFWTLYFILSSGGIRHGALFLEIATNCSTVLGGSILTCYPKANSAHIQLNDWIRTSAVRARCITFSETSCQSSYSNSFIYVRRTLYPFFPWDTFWTICHTYSIIDLCHMHGLYYYSLDYSYRDSAIEWIFAGTQLTGMGIKQLY